MNSYLIALPNLLNSTRIVTKRGHIHFLDSTDIKFFIFLLTLPFIIAAFAAVMKNENKGITFLMYVIIGLLLVVPYIFWKLSPYFFSTF